MVQTIPCDLSSLEDFPLHPHREIVAYICSLEVVATRQNVQGEDRSQGWYECRLRWVLDLIDVMQIPFGLLVSGLQSHFLFIGKTKKDALKLVQHFTESRALLCKNVS